MKREILTFVNEKDWLNARKHDLTSTDIADLFGVGRSSPFQLWHNKRDKLDSDFEGNERTEWGLHLQDGIMSKFSKDNNWKYRRMNEYIRIPELRLGSSFDFELAWMDDEEVRHNSLAEIKNVDGLVVREKWLIGEDGEYEAPPAIELQAQHQMLVSGHTSNYICACIGGNKGILLPRTANLKIHEAILVRARIFWTSIDQNIPPEPEYTQDAGFISKLYKNVQEGMVYDATVDHAIEDIMIDYQAAMNDEKDAKTRKEIAKAKVFEKVGDASKIIFPRGSISCGMIAPSWIEAYERKGYRNFKPYFKK